MFTKMACNFSITRNDLKRVAWSTRQGGRMELKSFTRKCSKSSGMRPALGLFKIINFAQTATALMLGHSVTWFERTPLWSKRCQKRSTVTLSFDLSGTAGLEDVLGQKLFGWDKASRVCLAGSFDGLYENEVTVRQSKAVDNACKIATVGKSPMLKEKRSQPNLWSDATM